MRVAADPASAKSAYSDACPGNGYGVRSAADTYVSGLGHEHEAEEVFDGHDRIEDLAHARASFRVGVLVCGCRLCPRRGIRGGPSTASGALTRAGMACAEERGALGCGGQTCINVQ